MGDFVIYATGVGLILWIFFQTVRIVPQREQYVVENLGKYQKTLSAGFHILIPFVQKVAYKHTLKEQTIDVPHKVVSPQTISRSRLMAFSICRFRIRILRVTGFRITTMQPLN